MHALPLQERVAQGVFRQDPFCRIVCQHLANEVEEQVVVLLLSATRQGQWHHIRKPHITVQ